MRKQKAMLRKRNPGAKRLSANRSQESDISCQELTAYLLPPPHTPPQRKGRSGAAAAAAATSASS